MEILPIELIEHCTRTSLSPNNVYWSTLFNLAMVNKQFNNVFIQHINENEHKFDLNMFNRKGEFFLSFEKSRKAFSTIETTKEEILTSIMDIVHNLVVNDQFELVNNLKSSIDAIDDLFFIDKITKRKKSINSMHIKDYIDNRLARRLVELFGKKSLKLFEKYFQTIIYLNKNYDDYYVKIIIEQMIFRIDLSKNSPNVIKRLLQTQELDLLLYPHIIDQVLVSEFYNSVVDMDDNDKIKIIANILEVLFKYGKFNDPHFIDEDTIADMLLWPELIVKTMFDNMTEKGKFIEFPISYVYYSKYDDFWAVILNSIKLLEHHNDGIEYVFRWIKIYYPKYIPILIERIVESNSIKDEKKRPYLSYLRKLNKIMK